MFEFIVAWATPERGFYCVEDRKAFAAWYLTQDPDGMWPLSTALSVWAYDNR